MNMTTNIMLEHEKVMGGIPNTHYRAQALSVEGNELLTKVADYFSSKLRIAGNNLTASVVRIFDSVDAGAMSSSELRGYKKSIDNIKATVKYNNVSAVKVPVTLGMKKDLHTSVSDIFYIFNVLNKDVLTTINSLDETVAKMLSSKDFRTSGRPFKDTTVEEVNNKLNKTLSGLLDPSGVNDRMSVRELLPNLSSLEDIAEMLSELSVLADKKSLNKIIKQSKDISSNIDFLYEEYKNNNTEVKKERLIELGYYLEEGAKVITTHISLIHLVSQFRDTFEHLLEVLDK